MYGVDTSEDGPVSQMQKHTNEFGIFLTLDDLKGFIYIFLIENDVGVLNLFWFFVDGLALLFLKQSIEQFVAALLLLGGNREDVGGELLIVLF